MVPKYRRRFCSAERLSDAPTSVFVITGEDIRRSGATNIPEALRLAPNLHVARISANGWAISSRGFNGQAANKLLVLIDGRSVYSPLFSGVFWDVQDLMLEDVERIEVISGPGGTLWGVNAVNGVVNVITRSANETLGRVLGHCLPCPLRQAAYPVICARHRHGLLRQRHARAGRRARDVGQLPGHAELAAARRVHAAVAEFSGRAGQHVGPAHGEFSNVATRTAFERSVFIELVSRF